nr:ABC transporter permease subunit [Deltaproteobacteria bacterium]
RELEEAAWASGAPWVYTFRRVVLPLLTPAMIAVGLVVFISAVRDIPTVVFLSTFRSRTLSLLMLDYMAEGSFEKATVIGVFVIIVIVVAAVIARVVGLRMNPNERG